MVKTMVMKMMVTIMTIVKKQPLRRRLGLPPGSPLPCSAPLVTIIIMIMTIIIVIMIIVMMNYYDDCSDEYDE